MSDANTAARGARESLARGLNALQSDPNVPQQLMDLAAPIAQAMGALHQIESTGQLVPHADNALNFVRTALQGLQAQPPTVAAVSQAMEAVAGSLGMVHSLTRLAQAGQPAAAPVAPVAPPVPPRPAGPASIPRPAAQAPVAPAFPVAQPQHVAPPPPPFHPPAPPANAYAPTQQAMAVPPPPAFVQQQPPPPPAHAVAPPAYAQPQPPPQATYQSPPQVQHQGPNSRAVPPAPPLPGDSPTINADLGTHSTTNFYKGLSGNDIIDHGGLFVSTYMVPKIGTPVRLKVSMPGGYEFEANAVVAWSREQSDGGADAPPGFGARFTQITTEARQLVYRYVRNREPLFHDDL